MTLADELTRIGARLGSLATIYTSPKDAVSVTEFPCGILTLTPVQDHTWSIKAQALGRDDHSITLYLLLGHRQTPIGELHSRALPWPKVVADALLGDLTLGGTVLTLGNPDAGTLFTYRMEPIEWGQDPNGQALVFWAIRFTIPVSTLYAQEMA